MLGFLAAMSRRRMRKKDKNPLEAQAAYRQQRQIDMIAEGIEAAKAGGWPGAVTQRTKDSPPHGHGR